MGMRVLTAYTPSYYDRALLLRADCDEHGVELIEESYIDQGSWADNIREKPSLIFNNMDHAPFLWVDADSRLHQRVVDEDWEQWRQSADVAAYPSKANLKPKRRWYEGMIFVNRSMGAAAFVSLWCQIVGNSECSDGFGLHVAETALRKYMRLGMLSDDLIPGVVSLGLTGNASKFDQSKNKWGGL